MKKQLIRMTVPGSRPHRRAAEAGRTASIALALWACMFSGKPVSPQFNGLVSFADGGAFSIVRRDTLMTGSTRVALLTGDIVETGPDAFLVIQESGGDLVGIGPSTGVYFVEREDVGMQGHQAVMLLHADERSNEVFDEQGSPTLLPAGDDARQIGKEIGSNRFFLRGEQLEVVSQASPSPEFVASVPAQFRDPLPTYAKLPEPVTPHVLRAVNYSDIKDWLTIPRQWRGGFVCWASRGTTAGLVFRQIPTLFFPASHRNTFKSFHSLHRSPEALSPTTRRSMRRADDHPMRTPPFVILMMLGFSYSSVTAAETLRCGSYLIQEGDDASSVLAKCGEPTQRTTLSEPVYASNGDGATFPTDQVAYTQVWRYDRGPMKFPAIIKIVDGVVQSIRLVK
jgi:hypothetical protein